MPYFTDFTTQTLICIHTKQNNTIIYNTICQQEEVDLLEKNRQNQKRFFFFFKSPVTQWLNKCNKIVTDSTLLYKDTTSHICSRHSNINIIMLQVRYMHMDSLIQFKVFNVICTVRKQGSLHNEILPFAVHRMPRNIHI